MIERVTLAQARRIALAAQGFAEPRPPRVDQGHLRRTVERLGLHQIDSVNVLSRAHYLPAFSRLGGYDRALLDRAAWGRRGERRLFEYWARADRGAAGYAGMRIFAGERRGEAMAVLARLESEGPLAASDLDTGRPGWWEWSEPKRMLEWLFYAGHITTATRRRSFERVYDLTGAGDPAGDPGAAVARWSTRKLDRRSRGERQPTATRTVQASALPTMK